MQSPILQSQLNMLTSVKEVTEKRLTCAVGAELNPTKTMGNFPYRAPCDQTQQFVSEQKKNDCSDIQT